MTAINAQKYTAASIAEAEMLAQHAFDLCVGNVVEVTCIHGYVDKHYPGTFLVRVTERDYNSHDELRWSDGDRLAPYWEVDAVCDAAKKVAADYLKRNPDHGRPHLYICGPDYVISES